MPTADPDDAIAAIATPLGTGGIAVVRISGEAALSVADRVFQPESGRGLVDRPTHTVALGTATHPGSDQIIDTCLASVFRAPSSYTGDDTVEISCHGGPLVAQAVLDACLAAGARAAEPGEFTKRAFLTGKLDLAQAEAVAALIEAKTHKARALASQQLEGRLSAKVAQIRSCLVDAATALEAELDFPDDVEPMERGRLAEALQDSAAQIGSLTKNADAGISMRQGAKCVIVGRPNVGKSTLMNTLLGRDRVIVSSAPGTTRDVVEDWVDISGVAVRLVDTAGLRDMPHSGGAGEVEQNGVERARRELGAADLVIFVLDGSEPATPQDEEIAGLVASKPVVAVLNKADLPQRLDLEGVRGLFSGGARQIVKTSLKTGEGVEAVEEALGRALVGGSPLEADGSQVHVIEARHKDALFRALQALRSALASLQVSGPPDMMSDDVRSAITALSEITGETASDEIIERIFERFCVGK